MRIGIIGSRGYPSTYSGYETLVRHLAPFLRDSGHEVTVYGRKMGLRYASTIVDGIRVVEAPALQTKTLSTPSAVITAGRHAAGERYSCVFAVNLASAPVLVVLQRAGTPVALNTDGLEWRRGKWGPLAKSVFFGCAALAATRLDHLVSDSKAIQDYYAMTFGASSTYIPYGLPQLWNVLRGDMSLVGPRPLPLDEAQMAKDHFAERLKVRPGITGPWQIHGRSDIPFDDMVKLDYTYVAGWRMGEDMRLLVRTIEAVFTQRGAY